MLAGSTAGFAGAAALSGAGTLWALAALAGVLAVTYCAAAVWVGRRTERRRFAASFRSQASNFRDLERDPVDPLLGIEDPGRLAGDESIETIAPIETEMSRSEAVRFLAAYFAAWALTPIVILVHLISGDRVNLERYEVIRRLIGFQGYWRSKSLRMAGIAAISTVTVVGAAGGSAFASSYTVQAGNDLYQIARANGTTVAALAAANDIANPNLIYPGQVINLTSGATTAASVSYTVQLGDTLTSIAAAHGTTVAALVAANNITNPNLIYAGSTLNLSGGSSPGQVATQTAAVSTPAVSGAALAVQTALAQIGVPYVWGGESPSQGFDCSGLVEYAWAAAGVSLPHNSVAQWDDTPRISADQLEPGDIVFYNNGEDVPQPGHEALYIGNGQVVAANLPGTAVQTQSIDWVGPPMGYGQVS